MSAYIKIALSLIWLFVLIFWIATGFKVKKASKTGNTIRNFISYWLPLLVAFYLLGPGDWFGSTWLRENFIRHSNLVGLAGLGFCVAGAIICCAARYQLGKNWSLSVQQKENHELVTKGIYTGMLLLFTGNALIVGDYRALIAVAIVATSLLYKIQKEEKLMTETFGESYEVYRHKTAALIPFIY